MGEKNHLGHEFSVHDVLLRIPLMIRWPARFPPGMRVDANVSLVDLFPTLISVLDLNRSFLAGLPGRNLVELLDDGAFPPDRPLLAEYQKPVRLIESYWKPRYPDYDFAALNKGFKVVIAGRFKYVMCDDGREFLYDLESDRAEETDLAPEQPTICERLKEHLVRVLSTEVGVAGDDEEPELHDEETREKLHALGYL